MSKGQAKPWLALNKAMVTGYALDGGVSKADAGHATLLEDVLEEDGLQGRVDLLPDVLQQHGLSELDGVLHGTQVCVVGQLDDLQAIRSLHALHPLVGLALACACTGWGWGNSKLVTGWASGRGHASLVSAASHTTHTETRHPLVDRSSRAIAGRC
jgi:hypothetical protein